LAASPITGYAAKLFVSALARNRLRVCCWLIRATAGWLAGDARSIAPGSTSFQLTWPPLASPARSAW